MFGVLSFGATGYLIYEYGNPSATQVERGPIRYLPTSLSTLQLVPNITTASSELEPIDYVSILESIEEEGDLGIVVDVDRYTHKINPFIYGVNFSDMAFISEVNIPLRRWGGNATTRYNWQTDVSNRASDWFFENIPNEDIDLSRLPVGSTADKFFGETLAEGVEPINTISMIGWTPSGRDRSCSFPISSYGAQQYVDPYLPECGNGVSPEGMILTGNDPTIASERIDEQFTADWIRHLQSQHGSAGQGGVKFYNLDNEPMLWHETHRDVYPEPVDYATIMEKSLLYASTIKEVDPNAQVLGPVLWGWSAYFYSSNDLKDNSSFFDNPDRSEYGNQPFTQWYLEQMRLEQEKNGVRLLDYLDLHYYSQAPNVALSTDISETTQRLRLNSTRALWDPTYVDESWIGEPVALIPLMHEWIEESYPGTKTAITEYNFGALNHITGAVVQADALGIFGRERLDMANLWSPPTLDQPGAFAFKMYRNYDGNKSTFGDLSLPTATTNQDRVSIYAARRQADGAITLMIINKSKIIEPITIQLEGSNLSGQAYEHYRYSAFMLNQIEQLSKRSLDANTLELNLDPESINLIVING